MSRLGSQSLICEEAEKALEPLALSEQITCHTGLRSDAVAQYELSTKFGIMRETFKGV